MLNIVERILGTEEEAARLIKAAREEASDIKADADRDHDLKLREARRTGQETIQRAINDATERGKRERDALVEEARRAGDRFAEEHRPEIERTVETIVTRMLKPEYAEG